MMNKYSSSEELGAEAKKQIKFYVEHHRRLSQEHGVELSPAESQEIIDYVEGPDSYDAVGAFDGETLVKGINGALSKLPGAQGVPVYSAQKLGTNGQPIPKAGDYVVANGRPLSCSENPYSASQHLRIKLDGSKQNEIAVIYKVKKSLNGKPIAHISDIPYEAEVLYPSGSAFKVEKVEMHTLNDGQKMAEIELSEVQAVPEEATILHYKGGPPLTKQQIESLDETIRVKLCSGAEECAPSPSCSGLLVPDGRGWEIFVGWVELRETHQTFEI